MSDSRYKKDKNQHIQVFVRVRPANASEKNGKSTCVVDVPSNKEIIIKERPQDKLTKKFTFDKVFGPNSKQIDVYDAVVNPLVAEVLAGYNCTVFAYGQTGTGKTFTMEGVSHDPAIHWRSDTAAGIIPRTLSHLFDELRVNDAQEYTVRVSFLELYNEELFDLLSPSDDASKIRLFEDASKKGSVIIHGLEEVTVHNKSEVYKILEKGSEKRQTAATLMNAHSSRSHTVFSITVHIKENTVEGEELLKTGKMNLVDLAGSENVGRSGAVDRRAREAGNINQSLLTLGRVITALVERAPHVPYRESKLTRLLQESLGGRTKTSIIATISPASINLEETLSTLDYAHRAKNITNRPEINQKLSKKALLKEYTEEIERLRRDLAATRERNGVYLAQDNYNDMQSQIEYQGKEIEEKINHIKALEEITSNKEKLFNELQAQFDSQKQILRETEEQLQEKQETLKLTKEQLEETQFERDTQKHLVEKHVLTEEQLLSQAHTLVNVADTATADVSKLHDKINRKKNVEEQNAKIEKQFRDDMANQLTSIESEMSQYIQNMIQFCITKKDTLDSQASEQCNGINQTVNHISHDLPNSVSEMSTKFTQSIDDSFLECDEWLKQEICDTNVFSEQEVSNMKQFFPKLAAKFRECLNNKLSENLQLLKSDFTQKMTDLSEKMNKSIHKVCEKISNNYDEMLNEIITMEKSIQESLELEKKKIQERASLYEEFGSVYRQMKELIDNPFTRAIEKTKIIMEQEVEKPVTKNLQNFSEVCLFVNEKNKKSKEENLEFIVNNESEIRHNMKRIKLDVASSLEQNCVLADITKTNCNDLVTDMETEINQRIDTINFYQAKKVQHDAEMREKLESQKEKSKNYIQDINKFVQDSGANHKTFMEGQRNMILNTCSGNKRKLDSQCEEMNQWRTNMSIQLHTTKHHVDKFLIEDLRRDQPTGTTPVRKEFQYPRSLITTSPHERIIQRFKESRYGTKENSILDTETEEETLKYDSIESTVSTPSKVSEQNNSSIKRDDNILTSTPKMSDIKERRLSMRKISSSNIINKDNSCESKLSSTNERSNDKENGDDGIIINKKHSYKHIPARYSQTTRKVLGSSN